MYFKIFAIVLSITILSTSCKNTTKEETENVIVPKEPVVTFKNKGHQLVHTLVKKVGDYQKLSAKKDVAYTYTYTTPDGKTDISNEKYIFDGELSYGKYETHQRTLPKLEGVIEQGYDGKEYWLKHNGTVVSDSTALKRVAFNRPTNFYWFAMFQKLLDPGVKYQYLGKKDKGRKNYDVVVITFESENGKPTDKYQLYINKKSGLVDQFLFTVADFGMMDTPLLMQVEYKHIDGFLIPNKRKYKKSTWNADITDLPWTTVTWDNITFNNGLTKEDFSK